MAGRWWAWHIAAAAPLWSALLRHYGACVECWERDHEVELQARLRDMQRRAADILALDSFVVIDTETTGLGHDAEIIEVTVLDKHGAVLLDTLVRPIGPIEPEATAVHGLTATQLVNAPTWPTVHAMIGPLLQGRVVVAFNAPFDERMIWQTSKRHCLPAPTTKSWFCAMDLAAALNNGRWPTLQHAVNLAGTQAGNAEQPTHRAAVDSNSCLVLLNALSRYPTDCTVPQCDDCLK
jgi:DNA polymerase III subunit epsilon